MKKLKLKKKLSMNKETVTMLDKDDAATIKGGNDGGSCWCITTTTSACLAGTLETCETCDTGYGVCVCRATELCTPTNS